MDAGQWSEGLGVVKSIEEKKIRPQKPQALNCPRCNSSHTKFCYYNNYSLSQPRYFCKTCRRYWTNGGSLRNVPVGGGSRRNKPLSSSKNQHQMMMVPPVAAASLITQNPSKTIIQSHGQSQVQGQDLNLISLQFGNLPYNPVNTTTTSSQAGLNYSAMDFLKSGFDDSREVIMNSILPNNMIMNSPAGLNYSFNGYENGGRVHNNESTMSTITTTADRNENARILFPFQDLKPLSTLNNEMLEETGGQGDSSAGYWGNGGLGGGSW